MELELEVGYFPQFGIQVYIPSSEVGLRFSQLESQLGVLLGKVCVLFIETV
jgi:hypothetical protein